MFDYVQFAESEGEIARKRLLLFTLSTCSFCAEAIQFLTDNNLRFHWIETDELPFDVRRKLRNEFNRTFGERMYYPALIVDGSKVLTGFEIDEWREALELYDE